MTSNTRQLQAAQNDLKAATRRADDAEKTQKDLQAEGSNLMRSLDEMRPKIVELTGVKLELTEAISSLELDLRNSRNAISELESTLKETTAQKAEVEKRSQELLDQREKERSLALTDSSELQKAYAELQEELDTATASLRDLEAERSRHHQETIRQLEEIERLNTSSRTKAGELSTLHQELDAIRNARVCLPSFFYVSFL